MPEWEHNYLSWYFLHPYIYKAEVLQWLLLTNTNIARNSSTNSHTNRPRMTVNQRIGSRKEAIAGSHIRKIADKKAVYNEGCLYINFNISSIHTHSPATGQCLLTF